MRTKILLPFITVAFLSLSLSSWAQNSSQIAGSYKIESQLLIINPDNTCLIMGVNAAIKGVIVIKDSIVTIRAYQPKVPFVLYGRKSKTRVAGSTLMFRSFDEAQTLINYEKNNNSINKMKRVFNPDANCIDYPNVLDNANENSKFYFSIEGKQEVYVFDNNQGYRDFIVLFLPQGNENLKLTLTLNKSNNNLFYEGKIVEKVKDAINKEELEQIIGMYSRAYSESEKYYCNPAYNFFEENGININSGQYKKVEDAGAYYFVDKNNELGNKMDYDNTSLIYEYSKIEPTILTDKSYSIDTGSVFNFKCGEE